MVIVVLVTFFFIRIISHQVFITWCEIIQIKKDVTDTAILFLDIKSKSLVYMALFISDFIVNECSI